jgi:hypothetical protein
MQLYSLTKGSKFVSMAWRATSGCPWCKGGLTVNTNPSLRTTPTAADIGGRAWQTLIATSSNAFSTLND